MSETISFRMKSTEVETLRRAVEASDLNRSQFILAAIKAACQNNNTNTAPTLTFSELVERVKELEEKFAAALAVVDGERKARPPLPYLTGVYDDFKPPSG